MTYFLELLIIISALCVALPVHEWAHAFVAYKQGDPTAKTLGRLTMAPMAHFDTWGFLCMAIFGFGWAKPVPIDLRNFKNPKKSNFLVSIAGVIANLIVGIVFIIILSAFKTFAPTFATDWGMYGAILNLFLNYSISLNFVLVFFNLLPIHPLDGFRVVENYTKPNNGFVEFMRRYSNIILIVLIVFTYFLDIYFNYTAGFLIEKLTWVFDKFFGLFV